MKNSVAVTFTMLTIFTAGQVLAAANDLTAEEIAMKNFAAAKVSDSTSRTRFRLINSRGQERVRETESKSKLIEGTQDNMRIVAFLSPSDVRGTKTLLIEHTGKDDDMWIYLPAMKKVRRLVSNNKKDSFVGTDISYGDMIGHRVEDWKPAIIGEENIDDKNCWIIEFLPRSTDVSESSGYSKRIVWVGKESFVSIKGKSYDLSGQLLKKFKTKNLQKVDAVNNKWQPMYLEVENVQTSHKTILEINNYKANQGVSNGLFTTRYLQKR